MIIKRINTYEDIEPKKILVNMHGTIDDQVIYINTNKLIIGTVGFGTCPTYLPDNSTNFDEIVVLKTYSQGFMIPDIKLTTQGDDTKYINEYDIENGKEYRLSDLCLYYLKKYPKETIYIKIISCMDYEGNMLKFVNCYLREYVPDNMSIFLRKAIIVTVDANSNIVCNLIYTTDMYDVYMVQKHNNKFFDGSHSIEVDGNPVYYEKIYLKKVKRDYGYDYINVDNEITKTCNTEKDIDCNEEMFVVYVLKNNNNLIVSRKKSNDDGYVGEFQNIEKNIINNNIDVSNIDVNDKVSKYFFKSDEPIIKLTSENACKIILVNKHVTGNEYKIDNIDNVSYEFNDIKDIVNSINKQKYGKKKNRRSRKKTKKSKFFNK